MNLFGKKTTAKGTPFFSFSPLLLPPSLPPPLPPRPPPPAALDLVVVSVYGTIAGKQVPPCQSTLWKSTSFFVRPRLVRASEHTETTAHPHASNALMVLNHRFLCADALRTSKRETAVATRGLNFVCFNQKYFVPPLA
jgi:hypothetical protein